MFNSEVLMKDVVESKTVDGAIESLLSNGLKETLAMDIINMSPAIRYDKGDHSLYFPPAVTFPIVDNLGLEGCIMDCREKANSIINREEK